ncbi:MAG: hypothetical protein HY741_12260 [Chloroflexi bacterium]|nr:hypothetical protein [Chloroflexota bacterium]
MTGPRYIISQFDNRTWQVNDRRTNRVYAECGDSEAGGDAKQRAERIARLLNGDTSEMDARITKAFTLAVAKRKAKRRATVKGQR